MVKVGSRILNWGGGVNWRFVFIFPSLLSVPSLSLCVDVKPARRNFFVFYNSIIARSQGLPNQFE